MGVNVYQIVTDRIVAKLQEGIIPWRRPWNMRKGGPNGVAVNWRTQKPYRGINVFLVAPGEYATYKQVTDAGGNVKKGAKSTVVVFWKWLEKEDEATGKKEKIPMLRYYNVFEITQDCEGLTSKRGQKKPDEEEDGCVHDPISAAEAIVSGYENAPPIQFAPNEAYYVPSMDFISVPPLGDYQIPEQYYSVLFHEMVHSTGHSSRLNREGVIKRAAFGDEIYSREELVAEFGAAMLCGHVGIENATLDNSAAYIQGWSRALKKDTRLVVNAASAAQKAADYILGEQAATAEDHE